LGGVVAWLIMLAALAVFALCLRARPLTPASLLRNRPRSRPFGHKLGLGRVHRGISDTKRIKSLSA
jgi:predicted lysophospholipase L1 biosynthesis ABC-type transport system permease subunit